MVAIEQIAWTIEKAERSTKTGSRPRRQQIIAQAIADSILAEVWSAGYHMARLDARYEPRGHFSPNPYVKEN